MGPEAQVESRDQPAPSLVGPIDVQRNLRGQIRRRGEKGPGSTSAELADDLESLNRGLAPFDLSLDAAASARVLRFAEALLEWNWRLNLISRADAPNVIRKHVAASLGVFLAVPPSAGVHWLDIGTGGGFPGLVMKMARPDISIALLESARKRCIFLEEMIRTLDLTPLPVYQLRAETFIAKGDGIRSFGAVTTRAVASLSDSLRNFGPLVADGGRFITFKGPDWLEELQESEKQGVLSETGFQLEASIRLPWTPSQVIALRRTT